MICPKCGRTDHEPGAKFCHVDGTPLVNNDETSLNNRETPKPGLQPHHVSPSGTNLNQPLNNNPQQSPLNKGEELNHSQTPSHTRHHDTLSHHISEVLRYVLILAFILLPVGLFLYYGFSNGFSGMGTFHSIDYVDKQSLEAWNNRRLDPHKYDYILNGEPEPEPITGKLIVDSSPQGANIILDGKKTGLTTPATIEGITEGEHKVSVKMKRVKITNTWYQLGNDDYSITFSFEEPYIPIVNH